MAERQVHIQTEGFEGNDPRVYLKGRMMSYLPFPLRVVNWPCYVHHSRYFCNYPLRLCLNSEYQCVSFCQSARSWGPNSFFYHVSGGVQMIYKIWYTYDTTMH